jgi:transglutaminase superfamily protein
LRGANGRTDRGAAEAGSSAMDRANEIARLEQSAARHLFFRPNCLEQSVALWWMLRKRGMAADLRIGARKHEGRFEAHAWVESNGVALNDGSEAHQHFVPFDNAFTSMGTDTP